MLALIQDPEVRATLATVLIAICTVVIYTVGAYTAGRYRQKHPRPNWRGPNTPLSGGRKR